LSSVKHHIIASIEYFYSTPPLSHTKLHTHTQRAHTCAHTHARTHMRAHTCTHTHARTHMRAHTNTRTYPRKQARSHADTHTHLVDLIGVHQFIKGREQLVQVPHDLVWFDLLAHGGEAHDAVECRRQIQDE